MRIRELIFGLILVAATGVGANAPSWRWNLPAGIEAPAVPEDNPMSAAKVALGRRLFYDGRLSVGGTMSCATCHEQHRAFASATVTHPGIGGNPGRRNVPGLANVGWLAGLTWHDPRVRTLEAQAAMPMFGTDPVEMGGRPQEILHRLAADACYPKMFRAAFPERGGEIDLDGVASALGAFQRTMISYSAPYDAYRRGDRAALPAAARRGEAIFTRDCAGCHAGDNFTDGEFHAVTTPDRNADDRGLFEVTGDLADDGRFRTPSLRNVALTGPYFHDGSAATLTAAIKRHEPATGAEMSAGEMADVAAFLTALTDESFVRNPELSRPVLACGKPR